MAAKRSERRSFDPQFHVLGMINLLYTTWLVPGIGNAESSLSVTIRESDGKMTVKWKIKKVLGNVKMNGVV